MMRDQYHAARSQRPGWLLPVGIAAGAIAAIAIGAFIGLALTGPQEGAQADPTPSTSVSATPDASAELSGSPSPTPEPTPIALAVIPNRAIAAVTVDAMAVRGEPDGASTSFGELGAGARLFIIGAPSEGDDERWYRVAYVDGPQVSGFECQISCGPWLGYVATANSGDEAWLEELDVECPSSPLTTARFLEMLPLERLHCYGRSDIEVSGTLDEIANDSHGAATPAWLADVAPRSIGGGSWGIRFAPAIGDDIPAPSTTVRLRGHFEDEAAATCRVDYAELPDAPPTPHVVLACRTAFVVTAFEVLAGP